MDEYLPLGLTAFGPHSLALGGRCFDRVILHTFFTEETTRRCVSTVKEAATRAGRDPAQAEVWSCLATIGDHIDEERRLMKSVGRLATYLQGYGDLLVRTNHWDPAVLDRFRRDDVVAGFASGIDSTAIHGSAPPHRHPHPRRVAGTQRHRLARAVRPSRPGPAGHGLRRGHHARGHAHRARTDRLRLPRHRLNRAMRHRVHGPGSSSGLHPLPSLSPLILSSALSPPPGPRLCPFILDNPYITIYRYLT